MSPFDASNDMRFRGIPRFEVRVPDARPWTHTHDNQLSINRNPSSIAHFPEHCILRVPLLLVVGTCILRITRTPDPVSLCLSHTGFAPLASRHHPASETIISVLLVDLLSARTDVRTQDTTYHVWSSLSGTPIYPFDPDLNIIALGPCFECLLAGTDCQRSRRLPSVLFIDLRYICRREDNGIPSTRICAQDSALDTTLFDGHRLRTPSFDPRLLPLAALSYPAICSRRRFGHYRPQRRTPPAHLTHTRPLP
ncbi:hypothetical protein PLICRDRAFT_173957 [Plicaturopsis crispa FD-325 SS-3]|nr:hypothetical protein PLICRDRAFT_173957 [Plicaturopsis crispa FD-325 SS-3]